MACLERLMFHLRIMFLAAATFSLMTIHTTEAANSTSATMTSVRQQQQTNTASTRGSATTAAAATTSTTTTKTATIPTSDLRSNSEFLECCNSSGVLPVCTLFCSYTHTNYTMTDLQTAAAFCKDSYANILQCAKASSTYVSCCKEAAVSDPCQKFCNVSAGIVPKDVLSCQGYIPAMFGCFQQKDAVDRQECIIGDGREYMGKMNWTETGKVCQRWDSLSPHKIPYTDRMLPDGSLSKANNYCRNPMGKDGPKDTTPFCFTMWPNVTVEDCSIPSCSSPVPDSVNNMQLVVIIVASVGGALFIIVVVLIACSIIACRRREKRKRQREQELRQREQEQELRQREQELRQREQELRQREAEQIRQAEEQYKVGPTYDEINLNYSAVHYNGVQQVPNRNRLNPTSDTGEYLHQRLQRGAVNNTRDVRDSEYILPSTSKRDNNGVVFY